MIVHYSVLCCTSMQHCQLEVMNPKSISVGELYGYTDPFSLEWKNGILARVLLTFSNQTESELTAKLAEGSEIDEVQSSHPTNEDEKEDELASASYLCSHPPSSVNQSPCGSFPCSSVSLQRRPGLPYPSCAPVGWRWSLLDGPVDSEWIENLNSVLDDSKVLCLSNGERIKLHSGSRILFETDDLANASPSTVSRCGVIFLVRLRYGEDCMIIIIIDLLFLIKDPGELGWKPLVLSWMKTLPDDVRTCVTHY